jgi:hypothetical protein
MRGHEERFGQQVQIEFDSVQKTFVEIIVIRRPERCSKSQGTTITTAKPMEAHKSDTKLPGWGEPETN